MNKLSTQGTGVEEGWTGEGKRSGNEKTHIAVDRSNDRVAAVGGGKYLMRSCVRLLKDSLVSLTLSSREEIRVFSSCPNSKRCSQSDSRMVAMVCSRHVVKPSNTCLFNVRPKMGLSSSGT